MISRRTFLAAAGAFPIVARAAGKHMLQMNGYAQNAETPLELLTDYLTPNELFFVRSHWIPHPPDLATWRLVVDGEVDKPLRLTLAELKKMPIAETTCVLQCAGNGRALHAPVVPGVQWRYGAVGNAHWRGVSLRDVLQRAGVQASAKHVHTFGSDDPPGKVPPFHRSLEIEKAVGDAVL
ncbi:MAG TPA: molybdopterin-dependent oxidoreductase, partial [Thermoanaerobaculia bacterium]|nr:molybdopterin-dependent oxidoreductase [Thermoanaerobaculia bacterium]